MLPKTVPAAIGVPLDRTLKDRDLQLVSVSEKTAQKGIAHINAGIYIFPRSSLTGFPSKKPLSFEYHVFPSSLQKEMKIRVFIVDAPFIDISTPEAIREAESFIKKYSVKFILDG